MGPPRPSSGQHNKANPTTKWGFWHTQEFWRTLAHPGILAQKCCPQKFCPQKCWRGVRGGRAARGWRGGLRGGDWRLPGWPAQGWRGGQSAFGTITSTHFSGKPPEPHGTSQPQTTQISPLRLPYIKHIRLHVHTQLVKKLMYAEAVPRTQLFGVICMFVVVNFYALAQASYIQIERRQVVFLCWRQEFEPGVSDTKSPADWMPADKPTELSRPMASPTPR